MAYFPDLTPYEYIKVAQSSGALLNVGWLDASCAFPTAEPDQEIVAKLGRICAQRVNHTRGFHHCPFCEVTLDVVVETDGHSMRLGSAEIRVKGDIGIVYACPNLIYHYVRDHFYSPPEEFIRAVRSSRT